MANYNTTALHSNCVAQINQQGSLTIYEGESAEDGVYYPARSIVLTGSAAVALKSFLNENLKPDQ